MKWLITTKHPPAKKNRQGQKGAGTGFFVAAIWALVAIASYFYTGGVQVYFTGLVLVPALAYLGAGIWELLDE
ncbi:MAG: hypothetical protein OER04_02415 [Cyclobacteriaceae bacterium]|nr:hypothetical protein [Cyclobacteriaceae bacterium]